MTGKYVSLDPLTTVDLPLLFDWINDRELVQLSAPFKPVSDEQHRAWFKNITSRDDVAIFGIHLTRENRKLIGYCQLHSINNDHHKAELQIRIGDKSGQGRGYGTEAVRLLLDYAFNSLNLHRVQLHVFNTNKRAIRVYEKVGFLREGVLREAAHIDGCYVDVVLMGILRDEYFTK